MNFEYIDGYNAFILGIVIYFFIVFLLKIIYKIKPTICQSILKYIITLGLPSTALYSLFSLIFFHIKYDNRIFNTIPFMILWSLLCISCVPLSFQDISKGGKKYEQ